MNQIFFQRKNIEIIVNSLVSELSEQYIYSTDKLKATKNKFYVAQNT